MYDLQCMLWNYHVTILDFLVAAVLESVREHVRWAAVRCSDCRSGERVMWMGAMG